MNLIPLPSTTDSGAWFSGYAVTRQLVERSLQEARAAVHRREAKFAELVGTGSDEAYAEYQLREERDIVLASTVQAILFTCVWVEGLTNSYGTRALGEAFFRPHLEKLSLMSKLSVIVAIRRQQLVPADSAPMKCLEKMFESRNRLVHRKTREFRSSKVAGSIPEPEHLLKQAEDASGAFRSFIQHVGAQDPEMLFFLGELESEVETPVSGG